MMPKKKTRFPKDPKHPERICWGCDKLCPANAMDCGNGQGRAMHPTEIFGEEWVESLTPEEREKFDFT